MKIIESKIVPSHIVIEYLVESESGDTIRYTETQDSETLEVIGYEAEYETTSDLGPITEETIKKIQEQVAKHRW